MRYHSHPEDARSSFHLAFMKILKNLKVAPLGDEFFVWSKRITVNTLIDEYRKQKTHTEKEVVKETDRELETYGTHHQNDGDQTIGYEVIMELVALLPNLTSKVFNLYVVEGYSHKEIATMLKMSEGTSKWHLSYGRKILRKQLETLEQGKKDSLNITL